MNMTNEEIVREYRQAKSRMKQIGILADENGCDSRTIVNILIEEGESVPGNFLPKRKKHTEGPSPVELEPKKESFELTTQPEPAIDRMTVAGLIEALKTMPQNVPIVGEDVRLTLMRSLDVGTGKFTESLFMEFTR